MIINYPHIIWKSEDGKKKNGAKRATPIYTVCCDKCQKVFNEKQPVFEKRISLIGKEYCGRCSRPLVSSLAGIKGSYNEDGSLKENSGRFTTDKWNSLSKEEQSIIVKRASDGLHNKLNENPELKFKHYQKIFQNSKIGYLSKGHSDLHENIKHYGFVSEYQISNCSVDECCPELKIIVEYNGDFWHCNPNSWNSSDYNKAIRMTAGEKWELDRNRRFFLKREGYVVIVVWEHEWKSNKDLVIKKIENEISKKREYRKTIML